MAEAEECPSLAGAKEASNRLSLSNIHITAYPYSMNIRNADRNASGTALGPVEPVRSKVRSDSLMHDTQAHQSPAEPVIQPSVAQLYPQPNDGPYPYFRHTFFNFNHRTVDINKIGIVYEFDNFYYIVVELPHPRTSTPTPQSGFVGRNVVGPYLAAEWASLTKDYIGKVGIAFCAQDKRWNVHSHILRYVRHLCHREARAMQYGLSKLGEEEIKTKLSERFKLAAEWVFMLVKRKEDNVARDADKFMEEFMVF